MIFVDISLLDFVILFIVCTALTYIVMMIVGVVIDLIQRRN
jgi:hypothetical protein